MKKKPLHMRSMIVAVCILLISQPAFSQSLADSDLKTNTSAIEKPTERIAMLQPQVFEYKNSKLEGFRVTGGRQFGFATDNMKTVFPELVRTEKYPYTTGKNSVRHASVSNIDMEGLIPVLAASIKELKTEIEQLKAELALLKKSK